VSLSKTCIPLPVQLIPNSHGLFQSVGMDTLVGIVPCFLFLRHYINSSRPTKATNSSNSARTSASGKVPWRLPNDKKLRDQVVVLLAVLLTTYFASGYSAFAFDWLLYGLSASGIPINVAMHRSLQVLLGHLTWVASGSIILAKSVDFFKQKQLSETDGKSARKWYTLKFSDTWVWWSIGGYYASAFIFNMADVVNQFAGLVDQMPEEDNVVSKMINPENNDVLALAVGSLAPCGTAPWWEEILYRGFTLPALSLSMPVHFAVPLSAILFAAHHLSLQSMIPLTALGYVWALTYIKSTNLFVTIVIDAMWNSRVFLGSLLGL